MTEAQTLIRAFATAYPDRTESDVAAFLTDDNWRAARDLQARNARMGRAAQRLREELDRDR